MSWWKSMFKSPGLLSVIIWRGCRYLEAPDHFWWDGNPIWKSLSVSDPFSQCLNWFTQWLFNVFPFISGGVVEIKLYLGPFWVFLLLSLFHSYFLWSAAVSGPSPLSSWIGTVFDHCWCQVSEDYGTKLSSVIQYPWWTAMVDLPTHPTDEWGYVQQLTSNKRIESIALGGWAIWWAQAGPDYAMTSSILPGSVSETLGLGMQPNWQP